MKLWQQDEKVCEKVTMKTSKKKKSWKKTLSELKALRYGEDGEGLAFELCVPRMLLSTFSEATSK